MYIDTNDSIKKLRIELDYITNKYIGYEAKEQIRRIASLSKSYPHSIRLIKEAIIGQPQTFDFTCHQYTFGLVNSEIVRHFSNNYNVTFPKGKDVAWLVEKYLIEINKAEASDGDFVVYFSEKSLKHSGFYNNGKIHSKWGRGHLWEHDIYEVPAEYGDELKFFRKISKDISLKLFNDYAKSKIDKLKF